MKRVSLRVPRSPDAIHPIHRGIVEAGTIPSAKLLQWGPRDDVTTLSWFDGDRETVRSILEGIDSVTTIHLSSVASGTYAVIDQSNYELESSILALLSRSSVVFVPPVTFLDTGEVRFEAVGESSVLGEFYRRLRETLDVAIESIHEYHGRPSPVSITERQSSALETALGIGYYDVPRTGSIDDLASELGCAPSTAGELLRKAEAAVITAYVDEANST